MNTTMVTINLEENTQIRIKRYSKELAIFLGEDAVIMKHELANVLFTGLDNALHEKENTYEVMEKELSEKEDIIFELQDDLNEANEMIEQLEDIIQENI